TADDATERLTIDLDETLSPGEVVVKIDFKGALNDQLRGFYRSVYSDEAGVDHTIAITQFESTNARRAFPCFDEPDAKAVFGLTLTTPPGLTSIACTHPVTEQTLPDGRTRTTYADTMLMSTYIVGFVVGELEVTEPVYVGATPIRIVHRPGQGHLTSFALEAAAFALDWLEQFYDSKYPGDKLDLVAAPDFAFGAMENMGCVTFRETLLLADPATATSAELMQMSDVIAHELAHMWFGNLVTMKWWEGIWLKEAFATFMEMATVNAFKPEWRRWEQFNRDRAPAFAVDSLASTRAIEFPVNSPDEAEAMYDVLTYEKGAAVVRMLEQHLGEDRFKDGVRHYLKRFAYGNTETTDLWDALEEATGAPVRSTMDSWIYQAGHPLVNVASTDEGISLTQTVFRFDGSDDKLWSVPVDIRAMTGGEVKTLSVLLSERSLTIDLGGKPKWVVANAGSHGFYRVSYEPDLHQALISQAQEILTATERAGLVDDVVAAVIAGSADAIAILELAEEFVYETDLGVWRSIVGGLGMIARLLDGEALTRLRRRVSSVSISALDILGTEAATDEDPLTSELRALLFRTAGTLGHDNRVRELATGLFEAGPAGPGADPQLFAAAVAVVAEHGDDERYDEYVSRSITSKTPQ
ncbi:MAG: M1 family metallopeptidase, partial [Actinobacteria bacterium]|nr:M1 family metallopeptidase [Actinomycetota bacterium]